MQNQSGSILFLTNLEQTRY